MVESGFRPWEVISSRDVFTAPPWLNVAVHQVRLPDGRVVEDYHQISLQEFVVIFAQIPDGRVIMERQYRHGIGKVTLVLPAGAIEPREDPLAAAKRELLEETGYCSTTWKSLGSFVQHGNYGCGKAHLFMAREAQLVAEPDSGDLEEMEVTPMALNEIFEAIRNGDIGIFTTVATIALATNPLIQ